MRPFCLFLPLAMMLFWGGTASTLASLSLVPTGARVGIGISGGGGGTVTRVEAVNGFSGGGWTPVFATRQEFSTWIPGVDVFEERRFFRSVVSSPPAITPHATWAHSVALWDDPLRSTPEYLEQRNSFDALEFSFIKFTILRDDLTRVYFQDSEEYLFHYDFAVDRLAPFAGMSRSAFDAATLHESEREAYLGAVLLFRQASAVGIEFVAQDAIPRETVAYLYDLVKSAMSIPDGVDDYYLPTSEQVETAQAASTFFAARGIKVESADRWIGDDQVYSEGYAMGRLIYVTGSEIATAYASGALQADDILLTDRVPAEVPMVRGILALEPATPNSHVAILMSAPGLPFAYVEDETQAAALSGLAGEEVVFNASVRGGIEVFPVADDFPDSLRELIASWKATEFTLQPMEAAGFDWISVDGLEPNDIRFVGGKAANFGFLRRAIPDNSPPAVALSFDLWNRFLDQTVEGNVSLRDWIEAKLAGYSWPVTDLPGLYDDLDDIRDFIDDDSVFDSVSIASVYAALEGFDANRKIRFRSSTNVEDSQSFVGAGLYESKSGCLLDDLDGDDLGPSLCEVEETKERGVFRAIRKVYASFYNDNAFLERLRLRVDESKVGMGVLVHHSFPDPEELANGVVTMEVSRYAPQRVPSLFGTLVTQKGAESITNPGGGGIPEVIEMRGYSQLGLSLMPQQASNRVPRGGYVLDWEDDYRELYELLKAAALAYDAYEENDQRLFYTLDFEIKKMAPDGDLIVKQIREVPHLEDASDAPVLFGGNSTEWEVFQGEYSDVFAIHRLKSRLGLVFDHRLMNENGVSTSILRTADFALATNGAITRRDGDLSNWPGFSHVGEFEEYSDSWQSIDSWTETTVGGSTTFALTALAQDYSQLESPLRHPDSLSLNLSAAYTKGQPHREYGFGVWITRMEDTVRLVPRQTEPLDENDIAVQRNAATPSGDVTFDIRYYWPPGPGPVNGYTAPLRAWDRTTISGLTTEPIVLTDYYSQSYRPEHHNFGASFIFEPRLAPDLTAQQRQELEALEITQIYVSIGLAPNPEVYYFDADGVRRVAE